MNAAMHDDPSLWPILPPRVLDESAKAMLETNLGTEWQPCWEFVLSHTLTPAEGSAFWHGAGLGNRVAKARIAELGAQLAAARAALAACREVAGKRAGR